MLPQTQCRRCGYDDCLAYAEAIVDGAAINRCPPGGAAGIDRLAGLTGRPPSALDPDTGSEGPLRLATIDEAWCIGCTLCLAACPVDCIVGAPKRMHTVVAAQCTGCELCLPACPVDCISMTEAPAASLPPPTGRAAWSDERAAEAKQRYRFHRQRLGEVAQDAGEPAAPSESPLRGRRAGHGNPCRRARPASTCRPSSRQRSPGRAAPQADRPTRRPSNDNRRRWTTPRSSPSSPRCSAPTPSRPPSCEYGSDFQLLVAVILSAQATDTSVNRATARLFADAGTPERMLALGEDGLAGYIRTIGLYRGKAKNVIATCRLLLERHSGEVPRSREALEALPGVGRKTANVVLNTAFGEPTMGVDTHILRVCNRTGLAPGATPLAVERALEQRVPEPYKRHAHHWLLLHGRYVCLARRPQCWRCPVARWCDYQPKTAPPP